MKKFFILSLSFLLALILIGCTNDGESNSELKKITGIVMNDKTVTYDGFEHSIFIEGTLPENVDVIYQNNGKKEVGTYKIIATLSGEGYETLRLEATLTIQARKIQNISFNNKTVTYDGFKHKIEVEGELPLGVIVTYTSNKPEITNEASEVGTYIITATLSGEGYETLTLTATLNIVSYGDKTFEGITFNDKTVQYDGKTHKLEISGNLPEGTLVQYSSNVSGVTNEAKEVGTYHITVIISKEGYQTLTLQATLKIIEQELSKFEGITFENLTVEYDSFEHKIEISGILPPETIVTYSSDVEGITNTASEVGVYQVTAVISKEGYETLTLTAKLTIKAVDKERFIVIHNNAIYFTNGLDNESLYMYKNGEFTKVLNDEAKYLTSHKGSLYFVSKGLISSSIKMYDGNTSKVIYSANAEYLVSGGEYLYYVVNGLTKEKSGIYRLTLSEENSVAEKIFEGKVKHLTYANGILYFANGNDGYKLYQMNASTKITSKIVNEKINELIHYNGELFFTVDNLLGNYLAKYMINSQKLVKLSIDNAKYITVIGNYVYYANVDILTTHIYGKGLYRVNKNVLTDQNKPGELLYESPYNVSSLNAIDEETVLFINVQNKHLMEFEVDSKIVVDVMENFEIEEEYTPQLLSKFETAVWKDRVYYINNFMDGALYYYDTKTNQNIRVTSNSVKSFAIIDDFLYFNQISWLVNNDLYMVNLRTGGLPELISTNDARNMVIYNGFLYYVKENAVGVGTAVTRLKLDSTLEEVDVLDYNAHHLTVYNGKLYYIKGAGVDEIWVADILSNGDLSNPRRLGNDKTDWFVIVGDKIYYRYVGKINKNLSSMDLNGENKKEIITGYDPISFIIKNGFIYFTNDTWLNPKDGIYRADMDGSNIILLHESINDNGFGYNMQLVGNYLYFYSKSSVLGDQHFYRINLTTNELENIGLLK